MKAFLERFAVAAPAVLLFAAGTAVAGSGGLYDMDQLLYQSHPFAGAREPAPPAAAEPGSPTPAPREEPAAADAPAAGNILSEVRLGMFIHDQGPFGRNKEDGFDGNLELLFTSPRFLGGIGSPRPHVGLTVNSENNTSQAYAGLSWEWEFWGGALAGFGLGGAVHNGESSTDDLDRKELGCSLLFRGSIDVGYRFLERHGLMLHLDHVSNADLCDKNEGLGSLGIRYGYKF